jgi:hypothetical protein
VQTFLPFSDFAGSAAALDLRRLGKQRVETLQILRALTFEDYGWRNHPAVTMWAGYTDALVAYGLAVTSHWQRCGFADTVGPQLIEFAEEPQPASQEELGVQGRLPPWLGDSALHRSHQAALVRKDPEHYVPLFGDVDPELPYVWPPSAPPPPPTDPITAWVVRASADAIPSLVAQNLIALQPLEGEGPHAPGGTATRDTKRRRQIRAFVETIAAGDVIVVPDDAELLTGRVTGAYEWRDDAPLGRSHTRAVRWTGRLHRSAVRRPVHLQDPRVVFGLRGESLVG